VYVRVIGDYKHYGTGTIALGIVVKKIKLVSQGGMQSKMRGTEGKVRTAALHQ
jgi:hypothetical protein